MIAADGSNFTGAIQLADAQSAVAAGLTRWISGLQYGFSPPGQAEQQITSFLAAGVTDIQVYFENTPVAEAWAHVAHYRDHIAMGWIAVEPGSGFETAEAVRAAVAAVRAIGIAPGIYTSSWAIGQLGIDLSEFADLPLWWAGYNGARDLTMRPIAGWQTSVMHQIFGADVNDPTPVIGTVGKVDLSYYEAVPAQQPWNPAQGIPAGFTQEGGDVELNKLVNTDAINAEIAAVHAIGQQVGEYIGTANGPAIVTVTVEAGYRLIGAVVKES